MSADTVKALGNGLFFHDTLGLYAEGLIARDLANHYVEARPTKPLESLTLDSLGGNTTLAMHLAQIAKGGKKCDHRHLDETTAFIVSGAGYSEYKQDDDKPAIRVDWRAGDMVVIPTNSWHKHINKSPDEYARQLSFRNTTYINAVLHGGPALYHSKESFYHQGARFYDRFADEPDYFTTREEIGPNRTRVNYVSQVVDEPLPAENPEYGDGVAVRYYTMGGQRTIDFALVGVRAGGFVRPHRPLAEESLYILAGSGRTRIWTRNGPLATIEWQAGDLVAAPLNTWREHHAGEDVRMLRTRNVALQRSLGVDVDGFDTALPDRFAALTDPAADLSR